GVVDRGVRVRGVHEKIGGVYFGGSKATRERLRTLKPSGRPEVARAFAAAGDTAVQLLFFMPADSKRVIEEMLPVLPKEIGGGPSKTLTNGALWAALRADASPKLSLEPVGPCRGAAGEERQRGWSAWGYKLLGEQEEVKRMLPNFDKIAPAFLPKAVEDRLTLAVDEKSLVAVLLPTIQRVRTEASRAQSSNNLLRLGVAMHAHHDERKAF